VIAGRERRIAAQAGVELIHPAPTAVRRHALATRFPHRRGVSLPLAGGGQIAVEGGAGRLFVEAGIVRVDGAYDPRLRFAAALTELVKVI
jgi:hypothetical protein